MSKYNVPEYDRKLRENYLLNSTTVKMNETCSVKISNPIEELTKNIRPIIAGCPILDYEKHKDSHASGVIDNDLSILSDNVLNKRIRRSVDSGLGPRALLYDGSRLYGNNYSGSPLSNMAYCNIRTVNLCQGFVDQYRDVLGGNSSKYLPSHLMNQDLPNTPSNTTTYTTNGTHINKIKTANSSGSSFLVQSHPQIVTPLSPIIPTSDSYDLRCQTKSIKSQNIAFSLNSNDGVSRKFDDNLNSKVISYIGDGSLKCVDYNSNKMLITGRKDSICSAPGEHYESKKAHVSSDLLDANILGTSLNGEETLVPSEIVYTNNCYLPTINVNEVRNSISYIGQTIPIMVFNKGIDPNTLPKLCLTQLIPYCDPNEQNIKLAENPDCLDSYLVLQRELIDGAHLYYPQIINEAQQKLQQCSSNNDLNRGSTYPIKRNTTIPKEELLTVDIHDPMTSDIEASVEIKTMGKFTVITSKSVPALKSIENTEDTCFNSSMNFNKDNVNCELNMNTNSGTQQPRSRFKKTRIRETIERWCVNGLNTYDCRFKVIPSKIMSLRNKNIDLMAHDYQLESCQNCGDRETGTMCYSNEYNNKEFRFWDNGDRLAICGKPDYETENYCQFHAKFLKLLNQNQNLSLSKFVPQRSNISNRSVTSSPQIIRAVLISSPENENYTVNIDSNVSQNLALSAPPVSPSIMNSAPISSLPLNLHSPQSSASMVMLRCHAPVLLANATRNATMMHESISIERINRKSSSKMSNESTDSPGLTGQPILVTNNDSLMELWQNCPMKPDNLAFKLSSPNCMTGTVFTDESHNDEAIYNGQQSLYSVGPIPRLFYSLQQQSIPSISPGITSQRSQDNIVNSAQHNEQILSESRSPTLLQEIDNGLDSLKSLIHNLLKSEQQSLINEINVLTLANEYLKTELTQVKKRSNYLESILKEHNVPVDEYLEPDNVVMSDLSASGHSSHGCNDGHRDVCFDS